MKKFNYDECLKEHDGNAVTRDGRKARLLCDNKKGKYPIVGLVGEDERIETFLEDGRHDEYEIRTELDLFTPSKRIKRTIWLNVYPLSDIVNDFHIRQTFETKVQADIHVSRNRIACVEATIDCEEGEGLD